MEKNLQFVGYNTHIYIKDDMYAEKYVEGVLAIKECKLGGDNKIVFNILWCPSVSESCDLLLKLWQHEQEFDLRISVAEPKYSILRYGKIESININYYADANVEAEVIFAARDDVYMSGLYYMKE